MGSDSKSFGRHIKILSLVLACSLILLALPFFAVSAVNAADFSGSVVSIIDGDTTEIQFAQGVHSPHTSTILAVALRSCDCLV